MKLTKQKAQTIANKVFKQLPPGWKAHTWENLGWHVSWVCGAVSLHYSEYEENKMRPFWTLVGKCGSQTGHMDFQRNPNKRYKDPRRAIAVACKYANEDIETCWMPIIRSIRRIQRSLKNS